jgi:cell division protein FtsB
MKWLAAALLVVVVLLQYRLWLSPNGVSEVARLESAAEQQRAENGQAMERNRQLAAEVRDLKSGVTALEERARSELGMIASNETFYQVVPPRLKTEGGSTVDQARTRTAAVAPAP